MCQEDQKMKLAHLKKKKKSMFYSHVIKTNLTAPKGIKVNSQIPLLKNINLSI